MTDNLTVTGYEPRFDIDLRRGQVGEENVTSLLGAISHGTIEVKTDYGAHLTGNVYIEYQKEDRDGNWVPSGISVTEAEWWAFSFDGAVVFIQTERLKDLCRPLVVTHTGHRAGNEHSAGSKGIKLPLNLLVGTLRNE